MNIRRVASLLRELAEALEEAEPVKPRKRPRARTGIVISPSPEARAKVARALRKQGVAA